MATKHVFHRRFLLIAACVAVALGKGACNSQGPMTQEEQEPSTTLYFSERGRVPFGPNEEIWQWTWIRKRFERAK